MVGNHFWGPIFAHDLVLRDLSAVVEGDIVVADDAESLSPLDALVLGNFRSFSYSLANSSQLVGIRCVLDFLVLGATSQLTVLKGFDCDVVLTGMYQSRINLWVKRLWAAWRGSIPTLWARPCASV